MTTKITVPLRLQSFALDGELAGQPFDASIEVPSGGGLPTLTIRVKFPSIQPDATQAMWDYSAAPAMEWLTQLIAGAERLAGVSPDTAYGGELKPAPIAPDTHTLTVDGAALAGSLSSVQPNVASATKAPEAVPPLAVTTQTVHLTPAAVDTLQGIAQQGAAAGVLLPAVTTPPNSIAGQSLTPGMDPAAVTWPGQPSNPPAPAQPSIFTPPPGLLSQSTQPPAPAPAPAPAPGQMPLQGAPGQQALFGGAPAAGPAPTQVPLLAPVSVGGTWEGQPISAVMPSGVGRWNVVLANGTVVTVDAGLNVLSRVGEETSTPQDAPTGDALTTAVAAAGMLDQPLRPIAAYLIQQGYTPKQLLTWAATQPKVNCLVGSPDTRAKMLSTLIAAGITQDQLV